MFKISAIRINEVELNPEGKDAGAEWIELFSEDEINLENWKLINNDKDEFELNGTFSGYLIINFKSQWLDNKDEKIFLYKGEKLIDETDLLADSKNNNKSWQFCGSWILADSTKGKENNCNKSNENKGKRKSKNYAKKEKNLEKANYQKQEPVDLKKSENPVINLNPQFTEKKVIVYESKNQKIRDYAIYGFALFLIFIIAVLLVKDND